jgi:hypothetical protein
MTKEGMPKYSARHALFVRINRATAVMQQSARLFKQG